MKYVILLCDGMADRPVPALNGKTPLEVAKKPNMDALAARGRIGRMRTLYEDLPAGSDVANLSVLGYDPHAYYTGRSPIEALGLGLPVAETDTVFRMNFVTLSEEEPFEKKIMVDNSAGKITTEEADVLVKALANAFGSELYSFYTGVTYRHVFILHRADYAGTLTAPHDILEQPIGAYLPQGDLASELTRMTRESYEILSNHPLNLDRKARGLAPANCLWLWGSGKRPAYEPFSKKIGLQKGRMVTAVPLIKGLAVGMGLDTVDVPGATGDFHTNYAGKAQAAIDALQNGYDFLFIHLEAPDECGHDGDGELKVRSIEKIDREVLGPVFHALESCGEPFKLVITPDHATPTTIRTHTTEPIPFILYDSTKPGQGIAPYTEEAGLQSSWFVEDGFRLLPSILE